MIERLNNRTYTNKSGRELTLYEKMRSDQKTLIRRTHLKKKNGSVSRVLLVDEFSPYKILLNYQKSVCAICGKKDKCGRALAIDHDHETGKVRGLLCGSCNRCLGLFGDNPKTIISALNYLTQHGKKNVQ